MKNLLLIVLSVGVLSFGEDRSGWTFKSEEPKLPYSTGLIKKETRGFISEKPSKEFLEKEVSLPNKFELSELKELAPVKNQGNCGSCVSFAVSAVVEDMYRLRGVILPTLSNQYQMSCGAREWMCDGSFFEKTANDYVTLNGTATAASYPYTASNASCKGKVNDTIGKIKSYKLIDNSPKSVATALVSGYAVGITVGADNTWMSYRSGVYNGCTGAGTNHQIELVGYDLEGNQFDSNGKLPPGKGLWKIKNSWGSSWGDAGYMWTKMTSSSGRLCNNVVEEAGIVEIDLPFPSPTPSPSPTITPTPSPIPPTPSSFDWKTIGVIGALVIAVSAFIISLLRK